MNILIRDMKIFFKNIRSFNFNLQNNKPNFQNIITKLFSNCFK